MGEATRWKAQVEAREAQLDAIYAELPPFECKGLCQRACGPIAMMRGERERLRRESGIEPDVKPGTLTCNLLGEDGRCTQYAIRPMLCRLFGMVEKMACEHGCRPAEWIPDEQAREYFRRLLAIAGPATFMVVAEDVRRMKLAQLQGEQRREAARRMRALMSGIHPM